MNNKRVLVVEDDDAQRESLVRLLKKRHLDTTEAATLDDAMHLSREEDFACVILDLTLPDSQDPFETVRAIPHFAPTPVIVTTGHEDKLLMRECLVNGAEFSLKCSDSLPLMTRVVHAIERRYPSPELEDDMASLEREKRSKRNQQPLIIPWVPVMSFALALMVASGTGCVFLYQSVSHQAARDQSVSTHLEQLDRSISDYRVRLEAMDAAQREMRGQIQLDGQDRESLRREISQSIQSEKEHRTEVIHTLERIEDHQLALLKDEKPAR